MDQDVNMDSNQQHTNPPNQSRQGNQNQQTNPPNQSHQGNPGNPGQQINPNRQNNTRSRLRYPPHIYVPTDGYIDVSTQAHHNQIPTHLGEQACAHCLERFADHVQPDFMLTETGPDGNTRTRQSSRACRNACAFCGTFDHQGSVCPRLYAISNWLNNHYGYDAGEVIPNLHQVRPDPQEHRTLTARGFINGEYSASRVPLFTELAWQSRGMSLTQPATAATQIARPCPYVRSILARQHGDSQTPRNSTSRSNNSAPNWQQRSSVQSCGYQNRGQNSNSTRGSTLQNPPRPQANPAQLQNPVQETSYPAFQYNPAQLQTPAQGTSYPAFQYNPGQPQITAQGTNYLLHPQYSNPHVPQPHTGYYHTAQPFPHMPQVFINPPQALMTPQPYNGFYTPPSSEFLVTPAMGQFTFLADTQMPTTAPPAQPQMQATAPPPSPQRQAERYRIIEEIEEAVGEYFHRGNRRLRREDTAQDDPEEPRRQRRRVEQPQQAQRYNQPSNNRGRYSRNRTDFSNNRGQSYRSRGRSSHNRGRGNPTAGAPLIDSTTLDRSQIGRITEYSMPASNTGHTQNRDLGRGRGRGRGRPQRSTHPGTSDQDAMDVDEEDRLCVLFDRLDTAEDTH
ncbi:unnamed protein product [Periconia digitata]|uniref:Uncharacterized protein n=1 Tax=Periconia digitata TaxID=1303443 RepID=A0A9W4URH4_9PLEO|nr:unnamed protein product [Periconia digitata]